MLKKCCITSASTTNYLLLLLQLRTTYYLMPRFAGIWQSDHRRQTKTSAVCSHLKSFNSPTHYIPVVCISPNPSNRIPYPSFSHLQLLSYNGNGKVLTYHLLTPLYICNFSPAYQEHVNLVTSLSIKLTINQL